MKASSESSKLSSSLVNLFRTVSTEKDASNSASDFPSTSSTLTKPSSTHKASWLAKKPSIHVAPSKPKSYKILGKSIRGAIPDDWPLYSNRGEDFEILGPIGFGASSTVYRAIFKPLNTECAVKVFNVDKLSTDGIDRLRREAQLMSLSKMENVLRVRGEWLDGTKLYIATRLMRSGSILDVMNYAFPDGLEEVVIATILKQALQGIHYFHENGWMHRDIKAANLLIDEADGTVLLADFGVSSILSSHSNKGASSRKSFVGTPSYMAPEVVQQKAYDFKVDIWSFGILAIELSCGRAPNAFQSPATVLRKTVVEASPSIDCSSGAHKFSKSFKELVDACLQKDPGKRPTAARLLEHAFFKQAKEKRYLIHAILDGLPPLEQRLTRMKLNTVKSLQAEPSWDFNTSAPVTPRGSTFVRDEFEGFTSAGAGPITPTSPTFPNLNPEANASTSEPFRTTRKPSVSFDVPVLTGPRDGTNKLHA